MGAALFVFLSLMAGAYFCFQAGGFLEMIIALVLLFYAAIIACGILAKVEEKVRYENRKKEDDLK